MFQAREPLQTLSIIKFVFTYRQVDSRRRVIVSVVPFGAEQQN